MLLAAEIDAVRSLNSQLFLVCHATYKAIYKKQIPRRDYYVMNISLTGIIAHLINLKHTCGRSKLLTSVELFIVVLNRQYRYCI